MLSAFVNGVEPCPPQAKSNVVENIKITHLSNLMCVWKYTESCMLQRYNFFSILHADDDKKRPRSGGASGPFVGCDYAVLLFRDDGVGHFDGDGDVRADVLFANQLIYTGFYQGFANRVVNAREDYVDAFFLRRFDQGLQVVDAG